MKHRTSLVLMAVHATAFLLLFAGKIAPGAGGNFVTAIGLVLELPGWFIGAQIMKLPLGGTLLFTFFFNAALYYTGGLILDLGSRRT